MAIKYEQAPDVKVIAYDLVRRLGWKHIKLEHVAFLRSRGSKARGTIARCHALGKAMQMGMGRDTSFYLIEVIHENYDGLPEDEKVKTIIHELMHIPRSFGGGFVHHDKVHDHSVGVEYDKYIDLKRNDKYSLWF
jgi:predicted metallopeptidase